MKQYIFLFEEGSASMQNILGGKGANLAEMTNLSIPVPPGFTISTEACVYYMKHNKYPPGFKKQAINALKTIELKLNRKFGDNNNPLLLSVRSGARQSMPGMMETILNIGLNEKTIEGLINKTNNARFAYDSYRRLLSMYADVVMEKSTNLAFGIRITLEEILATTKQKNKVLLDSELKANELKLLCEQYKQIINKTFKASFPDDPKIQLWQSINAVFSSWNGNRAKHYRKIENIPDSWGTAVNVQAMVFGNMGNSSATGVAFTRNPATGENVFFGEWLPNAQGEDVVAGTRTPFPITASKKSLQNILPDIYKQLFSIQKKLEDHYRDMQDIEFTVENNNLWILQTRSGKRSGLATIKIALDFLNQKTITEKSALKRINSSHISELLHPIIDPKDEIKFKSIASGLPAGPGAAIGQIVFDANTAERMHGKGYSVILIREETSPEDVHGMYASKAILTSRGGMTSHAALVARGWGKCCIVGCNAMKINLEKKICTIGKIKYSEMDWFTLNGSKGTIYNKKLKLSSPKLNNNKTLGSLIKLCSKYNNVLVRANVDSANDAMIAKKLGAVGVGLCRTEHMFFNPKRIYEVRKMIVALNKTDKIKALNKLLKFQTSDFYQIFKAMSPHPVTVRLLDPPLHEFLPNEKNQIKQLAKDLNVPFDVLEERIESLKEGNPMLGHRGCRLGITFPELTIMQTKAVLNAATKLNSEGIKTRPEIMIPLVSATQEFLDQKKLINQTAELLNKKLENPIKYLVGTMIELPRACFMAGEIAKHADFISFGTNDLTQTTFGFSRDDIGSFLPQYLKNNILYHDPFSSLDREGVGELIKIAINKAKKINPKIKIGVCGEHGGDPRSIEFFNQLNFNYVSCSPFRVPLAYLAIAKNNC